MSTQLEDEGQHRYYRHGEAFWRDLISQQAQSGQTIRQFCKANGVASSTFHKWRACLTASPVRTEADLVLTPEAAFVPLSTHPALSTPVSPTVNPSSATRASRDCVVLTLAGTRIELTGAHADRIVRHLLGRLGSSGC